MARRVEGKRKKEEEEIGTGVCVLGGLSQETSSGGQTIVTKKGSLWKRKMEEAKKPRGIFHYY